MKIFLILGWTVFCYLVAVIASCFGLISWALLNVLAAEFYSDYEAVRYYQNVGLSAFFVGFLHFIGAMLTVFFYVEVVRKT